MGKLTKNAIFCEGSEVRTKVIELMQSGMSVRKIFENAKKNLGVDVKRDTFYKSVARDKDLEKEYTNAIIGRLAGKLEERHEILEDAEEELMAGKIPEWVNQSVWFSLKRERVRAIEWDACALAPKKYKNSDVGEETAQGININFTRAKKAK